MNIIAKVKFSVLTSVLSLLCLVYRSCKLTSCHEYHVMAPKKINLLDF